MLDKVIGCEIPYGILYGRFRKSSIPGWIRTSNFRLRRPDVKVVGSLDELK